MCDERTMCSLVSHRLHNAKQPNHPTSPPFPKRTLFLEFNIDSTKRERRPLTKASHNLLHVTIHLLRKVRNEMKDEISTYETIALNATSKTWLWRRAMSIFPWRPKRRSHKHWVLEVSKRWEPVPDMCRTSQLTGHSEAVWVGSCATRLWWGWQEEHGAQSMARRQYSMRYKELSKEILRMGWRHQEGAEVMIHTDNLGFNKW